MFQQLAHYEIKVHNVLPISYNQLSPASSTSSRSSSQSTQERTEVTYECDSRIVIGPSACDMGLNVSTESREEGEVSIDKGHEAESDIEVVCEVKKSIEVAVTVRETYYDNDKITDPMETLRRWRVKAVADPGVNLSRMNYRRRVHKDERPAQRRQFLPGIFVDPNSESDQSDKFDMQRFANKTVSSPTSNKQNKPRFKQNPNIIDCLQKEPEPVAVEQNDKNDLLTRFEELDQDLEAKVSNLRKELSQCEAEVFGNYKRGLETIRADFSLSFEQKNYQQFQLKEQWKQIKFGNKKVFYDKLFALKNECKAEKNAFMTLFKSGNFQKGKIREYVTCDLFQPSAKRKKYDDDGHRRMLLHETDAKNVQIEDHIYNYFYGIPVGSKY